MMRLSTSPLLFFVVTAGVFAQEFFQGEPGNAFLYGTGEDIRDSESIQLAGSAAWDDSRQWRFIIVDLVGCTGEVDVNDGDCENRVGAIWFNRRVSVDSDWEVNFKFRVDWPGGDQRVVGDGLALVLNPNTAEWLPQHGPGTGVPHNPDDPYFAVEIDAFRNSFEEDYVDFVVNGTTAPLTQEHLEVYANAGPEVGGLIGLESNSTGDQYLIDPSVDILDKEDHTFEMSYVDDPSGAIVKIDGVIVFDLPPLVVSGLRSVLSASATYVGIAARTGDNWARFTISEFRYSCATCGDYIPPDEGGGFALSPGLIGGIVVIVAALGVSAYVFVFVMNKNTKPETTTASTRPGRPTGKGSKPDGAKSGDRKKTPVAEKTPRRPSNGNKPRRPSNGSKAKSLRPKSGGAVTQQSNATRGRAGSAASKGSRAKKSKKKGRTMSDDPRRKRSIGSKGSKASGEANTGARAGSGAGNGFGKGRKESLGSKGSKGTSRKTSVSARKGSLGSKGSKGSKGRKSSIGSKGSKGRKSSIGSKGRKSSIGSKGSKGRKSSIGSKGRKSSIGSKGSKGRKSSIGSSKRRKASLGSEGSNGPRKASLGSKGSKGSAAKPKKPRSGSKTQKPKKKSTQLDNVSATASEYQFQAGPPPGVVLDLGPGASPIGDVVAADARLKLGQSTGSGGVGGLKVNVGTAAGDEEKAPEALDWEDSIMFSQNPLIDGVETKAPGAAGGAKLPRSKSPNSKGKNRPRGNSTGSKGGKGGRRRSSGAKKRGTINPKPLKEYKLEPPHKQG